MSLSRPRFAALGVVALVLGACVTTAPRLLSAEQVASFRLDRVTVAVAPDARIAWSAGQQDYAASKGLKAPESGAMADRDEHRAATNDYVASFTALTSTDEARQSIRSRAAAILREELQSALTGRLNGRQPVRIEVTLRSLAVQNPLLRILVDNNDELVADVSVVEAGSGRVLATYPGLKAIQTNSGGIAGAIIQTSLRGEPHREMSRLLARKFEAWLLQG